MTTWDAAVGLEARPELSSGFFRLEDADDDPGGTGVEAIVASTLIREGIYLGKKNPND